MSRKLYRSSSNKVIAGICGGLGEHLDIDPTLVRLITVVAALASFGAVALFYLLAWILIPQPLPGETIIEQATPSELSMPKTHSGWRIYLPGIILIGLGVMLLLPEYLPGFHWHDIWPLILVLLGLVLILRNGHHSQSSTTTSSDGPGMHGRDGGIRP